ncbi:MAG: N-acetyltransferase GCN5 [Chloroflexi bacterium OLB14]|nr:MAG: N-acetyltransferase GCN5 [Chloroflexi bacterium OLB14]
MNLQPASNFTIPQLADLMTRSFEGYLVPININESALLTMLKRDSIELNLSRVMMQNDEPVGIALIARRGWTCRLAAMGILPQARNQSLGSQTMHKLIEEAQARQDKEMLLEVIEQNTAGVKLYEKVGFKKVRRLVGYKIENPQFVAEDGDKSKSAHSAVLGEVELKEIDIRELARLVTYHGLKDLPWQLSGTTIMQHTPPARAFKLNDAYCLISNPDANDIVIWSVLVKARSRGAGLSNVIIKTLFKKFQNKIWHVPALFPEEMSFIFEQAGMQRENISQWQMSLKL